MLPGPDADLHRVDAAAHQLPGAGLGRDVAADQLHVGEAPRGRQPPCWSTPSLCPCAESTTSTSTPASTSAWRARASRPGPPPTRGGHPQPAVLVLVGVGMLAPLEDVLDGDQPRARPVASTTGSFSIRCRARIRSASSSVVPTGAVTSFSLRHRLADRLVEVPLELQVAVGDDADQPARRRPRSARRRS